MLRSYHSKEAEHKSRRFLNQELAVVFFAIFQSGLDGAHAVGASQLSVR
jgi:hypothetical protein